MNQRVPRGQRRGSDEPLRQPPTDAALGIGIPKATAPGIDDDDFEDAAEAEDHNAAAFEEPTQSRRVDRAPADADADDPTGEIEPTLTRRSRLATGDSDFDVPMNLRKPGWDYEFKTIRVMGADVDGYELAKVHDQGWRPVPPSHMPGMLAPGSTAKTIDRMGMRLFMRPMHLTMEARREDYEIAERQKRDKLQSASAVPIPGMASGKMHAQVDSLQIEGEVGRHTTKAA